MSTTIVDQRTRLGFVEPVDLDVPVPRMVESPSLTGPSTWNSMKKMKPETAGTTIIGSRKKRVRMPRPRNSSRNSSASSEAEGELEPDGHDRKRAVRHIALQKGSLVSASQNPSNQCQ